MKVVIKKQEEDITLPTILSSFLELITIASARTDEAAFYKVRIKP